LLGRQHGQVPHDDCHRHCLWLCPVSSPGLLEGMSRIEGQAYQLLTELGTQPPVRQVFTAGGGAVNDRWTALRSQAIGVPVVRAAQGEHLVDHGTLKLLPAHAGSLTPVVTLCSACHLTLR
jgi:hypothetical protein